MTSTTPKPPSLDRATLIERLEFMAGADELFGRISAETFAKAAQILRADAAALASLPAVESLALERIAVPEGQAQRCPTCGEDEPFTGTCGTSDSDTRALCKRIAAPQAVPAQAELSDDEIVRLWIDHYPAEFNEGNACNVTRAILSARKDRADALLLMAEQALDFHGDHGETYAAIRTYLASVPQPQPWFATTADVSDAEAAQSVLTGRSVDEIRSDIGNVRERIRNSVHSDAAPAAEPESMNSHLTDGDGSRVQAQ